MAARPARSRATSPTTACSPSTTPTISPMAAQSRARASSTNRRRPAHPRRQQQLYRRHDHRPRHPVGRRRRQPRRRVERSRHQRRRAGDTAAFATARAITLANDGTFLTTARTSPPAGRSPVPAALTKAGGGRLTLVGTNNYTGGTTIACRHLRIGDGGRTGSIVGHVVNARHRWPSTAPTISPSPAPSPARGALAKSGAGQSTLDRQQHL